MKRLKLGIVGLGRVATKTHMPVLSALEGIEITAGAENNEARAERVKTLFGFKKIYNDYHLMLSNEELDGVYICLPHTLHKDACLWAMNNEINVLCEKPVGMSIEEAMEMNELSKEKKLIFMPGYKKRYNHNFLKAKRVLESGVLGKVIQVQGVIANPGPYISWDSKGDWYLKPESGGAIYDSGSHLIDLLLYLIPEEIIDMNTLTHNGFDSYDIPTNISCSFKMKGGIIGDLAIITRGAGDFLNISVYGTAGVIFASGDSFRYFHHGTDVIDKFKEHFKDIQGEIYQLAKKVNGKLKGHNFYSEDMVQARIFCDAIRRQEKPAIDGEQAVKIHRILAGMVEKHWQKDDHDNK